MLWQPNLVRRIPWCEFIMMMTFMEGQRSSEVKCGKLCAMAIKLGQKNRLMQVYDDDDLHGGQRSSEVKCGNYVLWLPNFSQNKAWCKFMMMMTFMKVKGHQRLNVVNVALWLPNLVRKNPWCKFMMDDDLHEGQRSSEVKCGKLCTMVTKLGQQNR